MPRSKVVLIHSVVALMLLAALGSAPVASAQTRVGDYTLQDNRLQLPTAIAFQTNNAELQPASAAAVAHIAGFLTEKAYVSVLRIECHSDNSGDAAASQRLSEQRALAVTRALVAKGVGCARLLPVGFGSNKPVAANDTPQGRSKNQRVEAVVAAMRGKAIGGMTVDGGGKLAGDPCK